MNSSVRAGERNEHVVMTGTQLLGTLRHTVDYGDSSVICTKSNGKIN